ncbi:MOSC domain-containing protein [Nocardioides alkalitolerans]|uniref:MOSC domain-containing protein n=1 Tax=Nocardioides alkalitolerans TaxID=281714 RepID=UPI000423145E|nr:MOSC N-terminal beta barrel domain-containing protein [Nocardioides alkalitolerans]
MPLTVTSLHRYPVKSMRGEALADAVVEPWGLAGDRRWMVVLGEGPDTGRFVSARSDPRLVLVEPRLTAAGLHLAAPGVEDAPAPLDVPLPDAATLLDVEIWGSELPAAVASTAADAWLSDYLGHAVRLVHLDDPTRRPTSPAFSRADDRVGFADGYPLLLTTERSLAALNEAVAENDGDPVAMNRFRPNLVVDGDVAWAEDDWRRVRVGDATFRMVKGCARCVLTTVDPDTGAKGREPMWTLARTRRFDKGVWFGVNLVPDGPADAGVTLRVGDELEVLEAVAPGGGPLRAAPAVPA